MSFSPFPLHIHYKRFCFCSMNIDWRNACMYVYIHVMYVFYFMVRCSFLRVDITYNRITV